MIISVKSNVVAPPSNTIKHNTSTTYIKQVTIVKASEYNTKIHLTSQNNSRYQTHTLKNKTSTYVIDTAAISEYQHINSSVQFSSGFYFLDASLVKNVPNNITILESVMDLNTSEHSEELCSLNWNDDECTSITISKSNFSVISQNPHVFMLAKSLNYRNNSITVSMESIEWNSASVGVVAVSLPVLVFSFVVVIICVLIKTFPDGASSIENKTIDDSGNVSVSISIYNPSEIDVEPELMKTKPKHDGLLNTQRSPVRYKPGSDECKF